MKTTRENVIEWAKERDLIKPENAQKQIFKLIEENGEIFGAYLKNDIQKIFDGIGDVKVVLIILDEQLELGRLKYKYALDYFKETATIIEILNELFDSIAQLVNSYRPDLKIVNTKLFDKIFLLLEYLANRYGTTAENCLKLAYEEIKNRKGKTINGSFVKEE